MATTLERIREIEETHEPQTHGPQTHEPQTHEPQTHEAEAEPKPSIAERLQGEISRGWAGFVTAAWLVLFTVGVAIEPAPADPGAPVPLLAEIASVVLIGAFLAALGGLAVRRRFGLVASAVAATTLLGMSIACPASGHHALAAWWFGQLACAAALVGVSAFALKRA